MTKHIGISIKVHRVNSLDEIRVLEELGVDYIGLHVDNDVYFNIDPNSFWDDDRYLMEEQIPELFPNIKRAKGFVEYPYYSLSEEICLKLSEFGIKFIQIPAGSTINPSVLEGCQQSGIKLIYDQLYIVPGDNPAFLNLTKPEYPLLSFFDLQFFPSEKDAWNFLNNESVQYSKDVITMEDIKYLAKQCPIFVSVNATVENINDIIHKLQPIGVAGISFTLSSSKVGSFHTFEFEELVKILQVIHA